MKSQPTAQRGTPDFFLLILTIILVGFGLVMVFSASYSYFPDRPLYFTKRQVMWTALGLMSMLFFMNMNYHKLKKWFVPYFIIVVLMLVLVLFIGQDHKGARSWFGIGSIGGQPSEFAKLGIILYLSTLISKKGDKFIDFQKGLLPVLIITGFVAGLIMLQPDLGSTMIFLSCALIVIIVGGANLKHLFVFSIASLCILALFVSVYLALPANQDYHGISRFTTFLDPFADPLDSGYQMVQSLFAFGHGGITGAGFGQSIQKLQYLPEAHNDFIFAIIGEELGFIGSAIFIIVYLLLIWRGLLIALRCHDVFGTLVSTGIVGMIGIQAFINIGGVTNLIPLTGVTLPFISFGGSSLLVTLAAMGILLSISRENNRLEKPKSQ